MSKENEHGIDRPTENWTRFPNSVLDNLDQFEPNEFKVLAFVIRKNLGWRDRANRRFAVRYVAARLNMADRTAWAAIQGLEKKGLIHCIDRERSGLRLYEVTWRTPQKARRVRAVAKNATGRRVAENASEPLQKMHTVLETKVLETSNADALPMHPKTFEQEKKKTKIRKPVKTLNIPEIESLLKIVVSNGMKETAISSNLKMQMLHAIELHGEEFCVAAIKGRIIQAKQKGQPLWLGTLLDPDKGEWMADCAKLGTESTVQAGGNSGEMFKKYDTMTDADVEHFEKILAG